MIELEEILKKLQYVVILRREDIFYNVFMILLLDLQIKILVKNYKELLKSEQILSLLIY